MDPDQIPVEIVPKPPALHPYFKTISATIGIFVLVAGLGVAIKLVKNRQNSFSKAGFGPVEHIDLSVKTINSRLYGISAQAVGSQGNVGGISYLWGVSSSDSIGNLSIHSSQRYAEFKLNGKLGRADIWVATDTGIKKSVAIAMGPNGPYFPTSCDPILVCPSPLPSNRPTPTPTTIPVVKIGDANGDGRVDGADYTAWLLNYGRTTSNRALDADFNEDGKVDGIDYSLWLNNYL